MALTQKQLAWHLGCTDRQLRNYRARGMPLDQSDPQCIAKCAVWIYCHTNPDRNGWNKRKGEASDTGDIRSEINEATRDKLREEVREKRLRNEETEGRLV